MWLICVVFSIGCLIIRYLPAHLGVCYCLSIWFDSLRLFCGRRWTIRPQRRSPLVSYRVAALLSFRVELVRSIDMRTAQGWHSRAMAQGTVHTARRWLTFAPSRPSVWPPAAPPSIPFQVHHKPLTCTHKQVHTHATQRQGETHRRTTMPLHCAAVIVCTALHPTCGDPPAAQISYATALSLIHSFVCDCVCGVDAVRRRGRRAGECAGRIRRPVAVPAAAAAGVWSV